MITVKILTTEKLIEEACALLYTVYIEQNGWQFDPNNPSKLRIEIKSNRKILKDRFTEKAIWFGAFDGKYLIGCARLYGVDENNKFEIEEYPSQAVQKFFPRDKNLCVEVTKTAVRPEYAGQGITKRLFLKLLEYCKKKHYSIFACTHNSYLIYLFNCIEWPLKMAQAFKYEPADPKAVNFYLADYAKQEVDNMIHILKKRKIYKKISNKHIDIEQPLQINY